RINHKIVTPAEAGVHHDGFRLTTAGMTVLISVFCILSWPERALAVGPPVNPTIVMPPGLSSMTVTYGDPGGTSGFIIDASTFNGFTGVPISSSTRSAAATTLSVPGL